MNAKHDTGMVIFIRFAEWCAARARLLNTITHLEAVQEIQHAFGVSRATSYRWLAAWREVHPTIEGATP